MLNQFIRPTEGIHLGLSCGRTCAPVFCVLLMTNVVKILTLVSVNKQRSIDKYSFTLFVTFT